MTKINFEDNFEIYLFTYPDEDTNSSKLNEFLSFLKFHKVSLPFKFSFVSQVASLIPEMTLNQNILIDFSPDSLTESKEFQFQDFLKDPKNKALEELYKKIELPHELPDQSNAQMKKVCSLIKSLLYEGQFLFLEAPEVNLGAQTLDLFINALKEHAKNRKMNIFIFSKNLPLWMPHSHNVVERMPDYSFKVSPIQDNYQWREERKKFYATPEISNDSNPPTIIYLKDRKHKNRAA